MSQQPKIMIERYLDELFTESSEELNETNNMTKNSELTSDETTHSVEAQSPVSDNKIATEDVKPSVSNDNKRPVEQQEPLAMADKPLAEKIKKPLAKINKQPLAKEDKPLPANAEKPLASTLQTTPIDQDNQPSAPNISEAVVPNSTDSKTIVPKTAASEYKSSDNIHSRHPEKPPVGSPIKQVIATPAKTLAGTSTSDTVYEQQKHRLEKLLEQANAKPTQPAPVIKSEQAVAKTLTTDASESEIIAPANGGPLSIDDQWLDNGLPSWAQDKFDILLLDVAGLSLAVPLIALGHIQALVDDITPLFGQSDWFMGIQTTPQGKIRIVNTAKFVMPERYQAHFTKDYRYAISINGLPWAIAVNSIGQPITVGVDDVRWRSERTNRPWLAGTIKQHMCALLDIPTMGRLLQEEDVSRS